MQPIRASLDTSFWCHAVTIHLVPYLFDYFEIRYTTEVQREITRPHPDFPTLEYPDMKYFRLLCEIGKLKQEGPTQPVSNQFGRGEASALQLAREKGYLLLIDDDRPSEEARLIGVPTVNTPAFIVLLYAKGTISYAAALKKLQHLEDLGTISFKMLKDARRTLDQLHSSESP